MDAEQILTTARQPGDPPVGWTIIPLNRKEVQRSVLNWSGAALLGFVFCALILMYVYEPPPSFVALFLIAVTLFVGIGSAYLALKQARMLANADRYIIVMTPELYVQQKGAQIISVPMIDIDHLTLRGVFGGDASYSQVNDRDPSQAVMSFGRMLGGSQSRRPRRTPDSLAFVDSRTDTPVQIAEDNSFTDLPILEDLLRTYMDNARRARKS